MASVPIKPLELMQDPKLTKFEFKDFIGVWENFVPAYMCEQVINHYEEYMCNSSYINATADDEDPTAVAAGKISGKSVVMNGDTQFANGKLGRKDTAILLNDSNPVLASQVNQYLTACTTQYVEKYSQLKNAKYVSGDMKLQKTEPEGGYHVWHYETGGYHYSYRELVWAIYLNDMPEGEAETEFLYQRRRIQPTQGTLVIWPASMTHVHKGNTVFTQDKYILTGWYIKVP